MSTNEIMESKSKTSRDEMKRKAGNMSNLIG